MTLALVASLLGLGCAGKQKIPLDCVPSGVVVFVDGRELENVPSELELRRDRHHTLFFKGPGYRSEMVVIESRELDGVQQLSPSELCVEPVFVGAGREIELEAEEPDP